MFDLWKLSPCRLCGINKVSFWNGSVSVFRELPNEQSLQHRAWCSGSHSTHGMFQPAMFPWATAKVINSPSQGHHSCASSQELCWLSCNGKCHFSPKSQALLHFVCVSCWLSPFSAKGVQLISGSKSCRKDFGTESSHSPHPAGNRTWNYGKCDSRGGRKGKCWRALQCVQNQKIQAGSNSKVSLAASTSLGMSFGCSSSRECVVASHPAQLLSIRLLGVFAGGKHCAVLGCDICPQQAPWLAWKCLCQLQKIHYSSPTMLSYFFELPQSPETGDVRAVFISFSPHFSFWVKSSELYRQK